jgi:hypothetical protein
MAKRGESNVTGRGKIKAKSLASRISGFSIPVIGGGLQWTPTEPERETVRKLLSFLEDRRALYVDYCLEIEDQVAQSVLKIREELTKTLQALPEGSKGVGPLRAMRAACRKFLTEPHPEFRNLARHTYPLWERMDREGGPGFFVALGELRAMCGAQIATLAFMYEIDVEPELASILPAEEEHGE